MRLGLHAGFPRLGDQALVQRARPTSRHTTSARGSWAEVPTAPCWALSAAEASV